MIRTSSDTIYLPPVYQPNTDKCVYRSVNTWIEQPSNSINTKDIEIIFKKYSKSKLIRAAILNVILSLKKVESELDYDPTTTIDDRFVLGVIFRSDMTYRLYIDSDSYELLNEIDSYIDSNFSDLTDEYCVELDIYTHNCKPHIVTQSIESVELDKKELTVIVNNHIKLEDFGYISDDIMPILPRVRQCIEGILTLVKPA